MRVVPSLLLLALLGAIGAGALVALLAGVASPLVAVVTAAAVAALLGTACGDFVLSRRSWRAANVRFTRQLPPAFAIGVERAVRATVVHDSATAWACKLYDHVDASVSTTDLPQSLVVPPGKSVELTYTVTPTRRGEVTFAPAEARVRSSLGLCELGVRLGTAEVRRVYPDFAELARYAWLAGNRRLSEIGIKTYQQRGEGTDFKQLAEYRYGDSVRHIDWKATQRLDKPIVREFQDERDQRVMLLVDCGRRMRADDRRGAVGSAHFDQVLNAVMLLSYVALAQGDAVGALTFGTPPGDERLFAPRKGRHALNALMSELYGVQPTPSHSDYVAAAQDLLRRQGKRALVIVITNFRDEDGGARHRERAPVRAGAARRVSAPRGARCPDGRRRARAARCRARQPLPRRKAGGDDLAIDTGARAHANSREGSPVASRCAAASPASSRPSRLLWREQRT
jgi:uncharacterized protein (DUF58 family)